MSYLANELRRFWLSELHKVSGPQHGGLPGLIAAQRYQVYSSITATSAVLTFSDWRDVTKAFAGDCGRMSSAAVETVTDIVRNERLPKSLGWCLVRAYYSAFFAAHAVERLLGRSVVQIDGQAAAAINAIGSAYGNLNAPGITRGTFVCVADGANKTLAINKVNADGSHAALWLDFLKLLRQTANEILSSNATTADGQAAAAKLSELEAALTATGTFQGGSWLSFVRNRVNYQHAFGAWYPYKERSPYYSDLHSKIQSWKNDPVTFSIWPQKGRELQRFIETSMMIVALCRELCADMAQRCPQGRSFHEFASHALIKHLQSSEPAAG